MHHHERWRRSHHLVRLVLLVLMAVRLPGGLHGEEAPSAKEPATDSVKATAKEGAKEKPRTGIFTLTFTERHPESEYPRMAQRYGWPATPVDGALYTIATEPYDVNVPADYDGSLPYGLMVHIDSGSTGNPYVYKDLMAPHKLIWIGSSKSPNERQEACRFGLAIDAVYNMSKRYRIDPKRIYVCGLSGGGRCASMVAVTFADVFSGGAIYMVGCNRPIFPDEKHLGLVIHEPAINHRYAFMTGSNDFNRNDTNGVLETYKSNGFKHVAYFETAGMGHEFPPPAEFSKAVDFLDKPLQEEAEEHLAEAAALEKRGKVVDAFVAYGLAAHDYPLATEVQRQALPKVEEMRAKVDTQIQPELTRLLASPNADKLRDFVSTWAEFPSSAKAKAAADALANKQLDALLAAGGTALAGKLDKFLVLWHEYPVQERALGEYDKLAAVAAAPVEALTDPDKRDRALGKYLAKWRSGPTVERLRDSLEGDLGKQLAEITAIEKPNAKGQKLEAFIKQWKGTQAAAEAQRQLTALIAALSTPAGATGK